MITTDRDGSASWDVRQMVLEYEVSASWWASFVSIGWMQDLAAAYFAMKVNRKMARWDAARCRKQRVESRKDRP